MQPRLRKLDEYLHTNNLDAVIVTKQENRRYLSGFTGSSGILVIGGGYRYLLTDFRYVEQAQAQAESFEIIRYSGIPYETLAALLGGKNICRIGFEGDDVTWEAYRHISNAIHDIELVSVSLDHIRSIKTPEEIELIKKAVAISDQAFLEVLSFIKPGVKETDIAAKLEYTMRSLGSERPAFDTIVASGGRGALPHGLATGKEVQPGDFITMDFGAVYRGYHSDITRTVLLGKASPKQKELYELVLTAQLAGINAVNRGELCREVDEAARKIIRQAGYGDYFGHGLGHSVGLAIHEEPRLSPASKDARLETGMVVTVEPGIYLPGWGGVRIEDLVVVTASDVEILTASPKALIEL